MTLEEDFIRLLQEEIASAAQEVSEGARPKKRKSRLKFSMPRARGPSIEGMRNQSILEFIRWTFFTLGLIGILVSNRFLAWIEGVNQGLGGFFSIRVLNLPLAALGFAGLLFISFYLAIIQKRQEIDSRVLSDKASMTIAQLAADLGKGPNTVYVGDKVLNELSEVKKALSEVTSDLNSVKRRLRKPRKPKKERTPYP